MLLQYCVNRVFSCQFNLILIYISIFFSRLTFVISVNVCRPEMSWMVLMATGIFTDSPSGVQKPSNTNIILKRNITKKIGG